MVLLKREYLANAHQHGVCLGIERASQSSSLPIVMQQIDIVVEAINILVDQGINPPVWRSGNAPGGDEWNQQFLERFKHKVKAL